MADSEWVRCTDPSLMLMSLQPREQDSPQGQRKLRLFALACCRQVAHLITDPRSLRALEVANDWSGGDEDAVWHAAWDAVDDARRLGASAADNESLRGAATAAVWSMSPWGFSSHQVREISHSAAWALSWEATRGLQGEAAEGVRQATFDATRAAQAAFLRDLVRDPFLPRLPPAPPPTPTARALAAAAYARGDGDLDRQLLAVLADALADGGFPEQPCPGQGLVPHPVVAHLLAPGPHLRGCWALDHCLGE